MLLGCGMTKNQTAANIGQEVVLEVRISLSSSGCKNKIDLVTQNKINQRFLMWQCWVSEPLFFSHSQPVASQQISTQDKAHPSSSNSLYLPADNPSCEKIQFLLLLVTVALR